MDEKALRWLSTLYTRCLRASPQEMTAQSNISLKESYIDSLCVCESVLCTLNEMKGEFYWSTTPLLLATP